MTTNAINTYESIETRRQELYKKAHEVGLEALTEEFNKLYDEEMELRKEDAIAIARNGKMTCFVTNAYECGWDVNTKINGEWNTDTQFSIKDALRLFTKIARENKVETCLILPECLDFEHLNEIDQKAYELADEEFYNDAVMASAYGDNHLLNRYNEEHGIRTLYSPSNPWDAPGMSIRDFI